ncbi:MAG: hypothetical protein AAFY26_25840 [Cyanobacteria bacterium J06638_22]
MIEQRYLGSSTGLDITWLRNSLLELGNGLQRLKECWSNSCGLHRLNDYV